MKELKVTIAFNTKNHLQKLGELGQVAQLQSALELTGVDGVTITENLGGYIRPDDGMTDIEYNYTFTFNLVDNIEAFTDKILNWAIITGEANQQISIMFDNELLELDTITEFIG